MEIKNAQKIKYSIKTKIIIGSGFGKFTLLKNKTILYFEEKKLFILNKNTFKKELCIEFEEYIKDIKPLKNNNIIIKMIDKLKIIEINDKYKGYNIIKEINNLVDLSIENLKYNKYIFSIIYDNKVDLYAYEKAKYYLDKNIQIDTYIQRIFDIKNNKIIIISKTYKINIFYINLYNLENCKKEKMITVNLTNYNRLNQISFNCVSGLEIGNNIIVSIASFLFLIEKNSFEIVQKILYQVEESSLYKKRRYSCTLNRINHIFTSFQIYKIIFMKNINLILGICYYKLIFFEMKNKEIKIIGEENIEKIKMNCILEIYEFNNTRIEFVVSQHDFSKNNNSITIYKLIFSNLLKLSPSFKNN